MIGPGAPGADLVRASSKGGPLAPSAGVRGQRLGALLLWGLALLLSLTAAQRLADGLVHLVSSGTPPVDMAIRWREVHRWFAGQAVYRSDIAVYPPASYIPLWPLLGWLDLPRARWLWTAATLGGLGWLAWIAGRESGSRTRAGWVVAALLPLAVYPARAVMVNGQLALLLLPAVVAGILLLERRAPSWRRDALAAALILLALTKPTLTAPFVWLVTAARGWLRPAALVVGGYAALTALASAFQPASLPALVQQFASGAVMDAARASANAHANLHSWIDALGLGRGHAPASLAALAALGWWTWAARGGDPWVRIAVAALTARFWAFHFRYDDMLVALALVALLRAVTRRAPGAPLDAPAAALLALVAASLLVPARLLFPPWPWEAIEGAQTLIWLGALAFLAHRGLRPQASDLPGGAGPAG